MNLFNNTHIGGVFVRFIKRKQESMHGIKSPLKKYAACPPSGIKCLKLKVTKLKRSRLFRNMPYVVAVVLFILAIVLKERVVLTYYPNFYSTWVDERKNVQIFGGGKTDTKPLGGDEQAPSPIMLTLFTTFKDAPSHRTINTNTIKAWAKLRGVVPVMYYAAGDSPYLAELARTHGWQTHEAPRLRDGIPVLKEMFQHALHSVQPSTKFTAFANADILFGDSLYETLELLGSRMNSSYLQGRGLFVSGRRIPQLYSSLAVGGKEDGNSQRFLPPEEEDLLRRRTAFDVPWALDYFIYLSARFPYAEIPDFVVGKVGFDNWLAVKAIDHGFVTVDTSLSIAAVHQVQTLVYKEDGWLSKNVCMNRDLVDPFDYEKGRTVCFEYYTRPQSKEEESSRRGKSLTIDGGDGTVIDLYQRHRFVAPCDKPTVKSLVFGYFDVFSVLLRSRPTSNSNTVLTECAAIAEGKRLENYIKAKIF